MSPIRFTARPSPPEPGDSAHESSHLPTSQHHFSSPPEYHLPETDVNGALSPNVDLHTLNYSLNRPMQQRPQDFTGWAVRPETTYSSYTYGDADANYSFPMNNHGAGEDPFAPRTTYPCDPRVIFNQNLDESQYDYPSDLQRQDQYALFGYSDPAEQHHFSRLSISNSPAGDHDYINSRASSRYPSPSIHDGNVLLEQAEHDADEPYAKLIYRALMEAPNHAMVLKDIYKWFEKHTDKASNASSKGWQNSIRHNLSMNGAFKKHEREPSSEDGKKYCEWVLEPSAILEGVKSTTRYRKPTGPKNRNRSDPPAPIRQISGRLGGQANRQQSQKRKFQDRLDRDMVLGQNGRVERFETTGRFGIDRMGARSYSPATPRSIIPQTPVTGGLNAQRGLSQCPPTPKSEFATPKIEYDDGMMPFFFSTPDSKDGNGMGEGLFGGDHVFDGLPTPADTVASLGEVAEVCMDDSPVFVDEEGEDGEEGMGPAHRPQMWNDWQFFDGAE